MILSDVTVYTGVALNPQRGADLPSPVVPQKSGAPSSAAFAAGAAAGPVTGVALNVDEGRRIALDRGVATTWPIWCASASTGCVTRGWSLRARRGARMGGCRCPTRARCSSRHAFVPPTTCHYCTFVDGAGASCAPRGEWACIGSPDEILDVARPGRRIGLARRRCSPLGDRPGRRRWDEARQWLDERGYDLDAGLRARYGDPGAGGDRAAPAI